MNIWETKITSGVTIRIQATFENLGNTGILGQAGPTTLHRNFSGGQSNTWYPQAIANKLAGSDLDSATPDIAASFNSNFPNWYFGTGGPGPSNTYDFETVVLHEIGHGLGFLLSFRQSGTQIIHGFSVGGVSSPFIEDKFATDNQGRLANRFPSGSTNFKNAVTSNNLFWNGSRGKQANGGNRPKLFAPEPLPTREQRVAPERGHVPAGERELADDPVPEPGRTHREPRQHHDRHPRRLGLGVVEVATDR